MTGFTRKRIVLTGALLIFTLLASVHKANAWVKITLNNNRSQTISVAFCWSGFDSPDDRRIGWYQVKPGESRVITLNSAVSSLTMEGFGFYANEPVANGKRVVWSGDLRRVIIDPKNAFAGHPEDPAPGGVEVGFRKVKLKEVGDRNTDAVATLNFNP